MTRRKASFHSADSGGDARGLRTDPPHCGTCATARPRGCSSSSSSSSSTSSFTVHRHTVFNTTT
ncbi:hypothetical protein EYF80_065393 [Liparis tanakae]|uniref:Uncharacterized protein n=1 Tax=Liparis tanakae TaxID=230148 RepID=A0A4Z2E6U4_9TELE|nr:hypothetical protein EYF80_065393 [Liparis tanakae]